jgi:hypothetical protein
MIEFSDGRYRVQGPVTLATVQPLLEAGARRFDGTEVRVDLSGVTDADPRRWRYCSHGHAMPPCADAASASST